MTENLPPSPQIPQIPQIPPPPAYFPPAPPLQSLPAAAPPALAKSPGLAGFLSLLPGVGHIYLGLYQRAVIFFAIWVVTLAIAGRLPGPAGVFLVMFWMFFVLIDAVRQAHAINVTGGPESNLIAGEPQFKIQGNLAFGVFMILFGLFFLIDRFITIDLTWLFEWWQVPVIAFGAWQIYLYYKGKKEAETREAQSEAGIL